MERDFKGVWIPKDIWLAKDISWIEKLVLTELDSLDNEVGCFATNEYIGNFFGLSKGRISKIISKLSEEKYISVKLIYKENSKQIDKRVIKVHPRGIVESDYRYSQKQLEGIVKNDHTPIVENDQDNNTVINNTINNNIYSRILNYLNEKASTKYKSKTKKNQDLIKARINEGFTEDDFIKVIDNKVAEWLNTDMEKYLRPETLFGTKFEGYLNQKGGVKDGTNNGQRNYRPGAGKNNGTGENKFEGFRAPKVEYNFTDEEKRRIQEELI